MLSTPLNTGINKHVSDMFSVGTYNNSTPNQHVERSTKEAKLKHETILQLVKMFFAFCEPVN